jgi:hypothetical protein
MRCSNHLIAFFSASCLIGATSCSDDGDGTAESNALRPMFQGSPVGAAGAGGVAGAGGSASSMGGAGPGAASGGAPGAAGVTGSAGVAGSASNSGGGAPSDENQGGASGANAEPPDDELPPLPTDVGFSDVFVVLLDNCTPCHATPGSQLPAFAQDDTGAAYEVTQEPSNYENELMFERIIARAVVDRTMPPGCFGGDLGAEGCVTERDAALLEAWIEQGASP